MSIEIRPAAERDHDALRRMAAEVVRDGTVFPFEDVEGVLRYWFSPGAEVFMAVRGEEPLGSYVVKPNHPDRGAHVANAGYLVAEAHRREGVGRRMGEHSLRFARERGYRAMQFNQVVATNTGAVALWEQLGFVTLARLPGAFRHPRQGFVDTLVMFREL